MKSTRRRALYVIAALLGALFILACLAGFAACGGGSNEDCDTNGHTVTSWTTTKEATCTEAGSRTGTCDVCGETVTETISALGHVWVSGTVVEATCVKGGYTPQTCSRCGATQNINETQATGEHNYVASTDPDDGYVAATCGKPGTSVKKCTMCGDIVTDTIPATGEHTWGEGVVTTEPTIYAEGVKTYTCTVCGETKTETIAKLTPGDYTSNFLTGSLANADDDYVTYVNWEDNTTSAKFAGSEIEVEFDTTSNSEQYSYVVSGTAAVMDDSQLAAFWGSGADDHANAQYITIAFVAKTGETFTIKSNKSQSGLQIDGDAVNSNGDPDKDNTFYTLVYDVSNWSEENTGETVFTITDENEDEYPVVIGDIELFTVVDSEDELTSALQQGGEIALADDIEITSALEVSADTELDLEGNTLSTGDGWTAETRTSGNVSDVMISVGKGANLTIEDTSEDGSGKIDYSYSNSNTASAWGNTYNWSSAGNHGAAIMVDGDETTSVTIESGDIETTSVGIRAKNGDIVINGGTIHSTGFYVIWEDTGITSVTINDGKVSGDWGGILVDGDSNFKGEGSYGTGAKTTLTVNGGKIYSGGTNQAAIRTENKTSTDSAYIEINGGKITCADNGGTKNEAAIYLANGTLKVTGGVITGPTALEVQAGKATVEGGKFVAKYGEGNASQNVNTTSSSSDPFTYGYSLAVYPRANVTRTDIDNFSMAVDVTVTGGTFDGDVLVSEVIYGQTSPADGWILNAAGSNYKVSISGITGEIKVAVATEFMLDWAVALDKVTVVLGQNITVSDTVTISTTVILDLNGYTLSCATDDTIKVTETGKLTVIDGSEEKTGTVDATAHGKAALVNEGGTVTLNGGTFERSAEAGTSSSSNGGNSYYTVVNHGTMTINDGVTIFNKGAYSSNLENGWYEGGDETMSATLYVYGGHIYGGLYAIKNDSCGTLYIYGGTIGGARSEEDTMPYRALLNWNEAYIYGGTLLGGNGNDSKDEYGNDCDGFAIYNTASENSYESGKLVIGCKEGETGPTIKYEGQGSSTSGSGWGWAIYMDAGTVEIDGGTVWGQESNYTYGASGIYIYSGTLEINGGTISGYYSLEIDGGSVTINGGTFVEPICLYADEYSNNGTLTFGEDVEEGFEKKMYDSSWNVTNDENDADFIEYTQKSATDEEEPEDGNDGGNIGDTGDDGNGGDDGGDN